MADIPQAQPLPQLGQIQPIGIGEGIARGIEAGSRMNYQSGVLQNQNQQLQLEQQKFAQEKQKEELVNNLAKFNQLATLYKNTHKSLRPKLWPSVAQSSNQLLGTQLDPNIMPESADDAIDAAHNEINLLINKKQSFDDTMKKLGMIAVTTDEETRKAVEASKEFLLSTKEGQATKNQGTGTFTFQGYEPVTRKQVFSNSKAPVLITGDGQPVTGPIQSKPEFDKANEEIQRLQGIQSSLNDLDSMLSKIPSGWKGGLESLAASLPGGSMLAQDAKQYQDQMPAIAVAFYRAATGDTRLSDADAKARALPFLPQVFESANKRQEKSNIMRSMIDRRRDALANGVSEISFDPNSVKSKASKGPVSGLSASAQDLISKWENK